jgi:hypothetical protein
MYINGDGYFVDFSETETYYDSKQKCLRIIYRSDTPTKKDINKFIKHSFIKLTKKQILKIFYDKDWHYTNDGCPYGIIVVFY